MTTVRHTVCLLLVLGSSMLVAGPRRAVAENTHFVATSGVNFVVDSQIKYFAGTNNYYQMMHRSDGHAGVDEVLDEMEARSMNLLRIWAFNELGERSWDCLQCGPNAQLTGGAKPTDFLNENTFQGLDEVLAEANDRNIRVVMTLVNNWDDFGGMNRYATWRGGGAVHDDFYRDETIKGWFKDYIDVMVNRENTVNGRTYKDDPTIFSWQLANEPRALSGGQDRATHAEIDDWIAEISGYIKSVDPNHMVSTGAEGFYGPSNVDKNVAAWMQNEGTDFIINHAHDSIDYAVAHSWAQNWGWNPINNTASAKANAIDHVEQRIDDAENILGKPFVLEEFGIPRNNFGTGINSGPTTIRDEFFEDVYLGLCAASAQAGGACGGTNSWIIFDGPTAAYDDQNGIFLPQDTSTDAIITAHAQLLASLTFGPELPGDYNLDGIVNAADYTVWRDLLGQSVALPNETVTLGMVTQEDYNEWVANFGNMLDGSGALSSAAVPEPASVLLVILAVASVSLYRQAPGVFQNLSPVKSFDFYRLRSVGLFGA